MAERGKEGGRREQDVKKRGGGGAGPPGLFSKHLVSVYGSSLSPPAIRQKMCIANDASVMQG